MGHYASGFSTGMKVEIRIPIPHGKAFSDWAVIKAIHDDLVSVQLSRDILPEGVSLRVGQTIECRNVNDENGCSHQAIVISKGFAQELQLRLIGEIAVGQQREFYRIDVFLPITFHLLRSQRTYSLHKQWEWHRKMRKAEERARKKKHLEYARNQNHWEISHEGTTATSPAKKEKGGKLAFDLYDESWETVLPHAVNICGGGMSLTTHQEFDIDEYVLLEIFIPSTHRVVATVARVIFANRNYAIGKDQKYFHTGMQFVFIDEGDRSAIINYIAHIQLTRIRQLQGFTGEPLYNATNEPQSSDHLIIRGDYGAGNDGKTSPRISWLSITIVLVVLIFCCIGMLILLLLVSSVRGPLNDMGKSIERSFEIYKGN